MQTLSKRFKRKRFARRGRGKREQTVALGAALAMPWALAMVVFIMLGLGLALPYVLISLSPRLLARLPRPGPWMERLKGLLAFPMYGTALWLA